MAALLGYGSFSFQRLFHPPGLLSFTDLSNFLNGSKGGVIKDVVIIHVITKEKTKITFDSAIDAIHNLAKKESDFFPIRDYTAKYYHHPEKEIDAGLVAIRELYRCLEETRPPSLFSCFFPRSRYWNFDNINARLNDLKETLHRVKQVYDYVRANRGRYPERYIRPKDSGLARAISFNRGSIVVHFNKKKKGDERLGKGSAKNVNIAIEMGTGTLFATAGCEQDCSEEFKYLEAFKGDPGFIQLIDCVEYESKKGAGKKYRAIFEFCNQRSLEVVLMNRKLTVGEQKTIFYTLIEKVALMHEKDYLHRDLKMGNIFLHQVDKKILRPVIGDFGSACRQEDESSRKGHWTTLTAISPEYAKILLTCKDEEREEELLKVNTAALDSWSLALVLRKVLGIRDEFWDRMEKYKLKVYLKCLADHQGEWFKEPEAENSPEHLVWEIFERRLSATEAARKLPEVCWPASDS